MERGALDALQTLTLTVLKGGGGRGGAGGAPAPAGLPLCFRLLLGQLARTLPELLEGSSTLMDDFSAHLKLSSMHPARGLPRPAAMMLLEVRNRAHFKITVPRYGSGYLSVMSV